MTNTITNEQLGNILTDTLNSLHNKTTDKVMKSIMTDKDWGNVRGYLWDLTMLINNQKIEDKIWEVINEIDSFRKAEGK